MTQDDSPPNTLEAVYSFICTYLVDHNGYSPSLREIAKGCFISVSNVLRYVDKLEGQGRIAREPGMARSIRLVGSDSEKNETNVRTDVHPN